MTDIRILPDIVVSRIAAGEVIERPYSVVKELIENSLDASADRIDIELVSGGKRRISVSDNGTGMTRDNAIMSLERHATSKIKDVNDIFSIGTLGFRGEALPSIASVSNFTIRTRTRDDLSGTEIYVRGGVIKKVQEAGCPAGTMVEVQRLFFNTPPRLKFMKTVETELGRILDIVQREAVSNPRVAFEVIHNGNKVLSLRKKKDSLERIKDVIPNVELFEITDHLGDNSVQAFMSSPLSTRTTTQKLFTFVNGRPVKDRFITKMIMDGYGKQIEYRKFPQGVLFLKVPPSELDVNVHPTKHEIRFRNQKVVADLIKRSIGKMLDQAPWLKGNYQYTVSSYTQTTNNKLYNNYGGTPRNTEKFREYNESMLYGRSEGPVPRVHDDTHDKGTHLSGNELAGYPGEQKPGNMFEEEKYFASLNIVGQVRNLYILCETDKGLVLVDQHAAHERVNYEKVKTNYCDNSKNNIQELLIPEVIELSQGELRNFENLNVHLESLGFIAQRFGESAVRLKAVPSLLGNMGFAELFKDILCELEELGDSETLNDKIDLIFATIACHSSIRANQSLNVEQIKSLFKELDESESPFSCPHGRPVVRELSFDYLERIFRRS